MLVGVPVEPSVEKLTASGLVSAASTARMSFHSFCWDVSGYGYQQLAA
jgi:hypothetical protein